MHACQETFRAAPIYFSRACLPRAQAMGSLKFLDAFGMEGFMHALRPVLHTALFFNPRFSGRPVLNAWPLGISLEALGVGHFFRPP
jgi:hypothetical protein